MKPQQNELYIIIKVFNGSRCLFQTHTFFSAESQDPEPPIDNEEDVETYEPSRSRTKHRFTNRRIIDETSASEDEVVVRAPRCSQGI